MTATRRAVRSLSWLVLAYIALAALYVSAVDSGSLGFLTLPIGLLSAAAEPLALLAGAFILARYAVELHAELTNPKDLP